jgi:DNA modification methylase
MKPYYEHSGITIYHGDCLEILPTLAPASVDLVVTDPPYGMKYESNWNGAGDPIVGDDSVPIEWLREVRRLSKSRTALYWFAYEGSIEATRTAIRSIGYGLHTMLVWDKQVSTGGDLSDYGRRTEYVVYATLGGSRLNGNRDANLISVPRVHQSRRLHPTEKPLALLTYLVVRTSAPSELVLDPFMGSGTALLAASSLNRRAIGIEIEERYCEIAAKRLQQEVLPLEQPA